MHASGDLQQHMRSDRECSLIEHHFPLDCDEDDEQGCGPGLFCGVSNCAKFHEIGAARGIPSGADCCDRLVSDGEGARTSCPAIM